MGLLGGKIRDMSENGWFITNPNIRRPIGRVVEVLGDGSVLVEFGAVISSPMSEAEIEVGDEVEVLEIHPSMNSRLLPKVGDRFKVAKIYRRYTGDWDAYLPVGGRGLACRVRRVSSEVAEVKVWNEMESTPKRCAFCEDPFSTHPQNDPPVERIDHCLDVKKFYHRACLSLLERREAAERSERRK